MVGNRRLLYVLVLLAVLVQGCARVRVQPTPAPVRLKVLLLPYLGFAPLYIAEQAGYFSEQKLEVEFVKLTKIDEALPLLAQGELDVAAGTMSVSMLNAIAQGAAVRIVADKGYVDPEGCVYNAVMARRTLVETGELKDASHLKGRRMYVSRAVVEGYFVDKLMQTGGLTLDDLQMVDISPPLEPEALAKGQIDCTVSSEPWVTRIVNGGNAVIWVPIQDVLPGSQFATILFGPTLLEKNRDAGKRFLVAYLKAVRQYNEGKTEENVRLLADLSGLEPTLVQQTCWLPIHGDGSIDVQGVLDFQAWAVQKGYLQTAVTEKELWDGEFVEYANRVLGPEG